MNAVNAFFSLLLNFEDLYKFLVCFKFYVMTIVHTVQLLLQR
jgi:hypothetical protein